MRDNGSPIDETAIELQKTIGESYRLVAESLEMLNAKASKLIGDIRSGHLTGVEIEARHAEINALNKHVMRLNAAAKKAEETLRIYQENNTENIKKT